MDSEQNSTPVISGLRMNRFGQLHPVQVERPAGGGLDVLARFVRCEPHELHSVQLTDWVQVWVNVSRIDGDSARNEVLSATASRLGDRNISLGGDGLFLATVPETWTLTGLSDAQVATVETAHGEALRDLGVVA